LDHYDQPLLAKLYGIILEKKLSIWLESEGKRVKGQVSFKRHHSTTDHLVTLRIIVEECRNDKSNLFCCFVDFRKAFDTVHRNNLWNRLEELKVPFELRAIAIRLYENVIAKLKSNEGWSKDIKCNIKVKQGFPLSPTLFGIYIDKLEGYLEEASCVGTILAGIVIIILLYVDDIVLLARCTSDLDKQLRLLKIRTNSHELHSETGHWVVPKTPWLERICHLFENRNIEDENHFLLECPSATTLDLNFKIFAATLTFLAFYNVKIIVSSRGFSPNFLNIEIKF